MAESPITSEDVGPITDGATACDHLAELSQTREKFQDFLEWMLTSTGTLHADFLAQLVSQFLVDAAKKGWFVQTDATTGELELIEVIPLDGLDDGDAVDGDYLKFNGTDWVKQTPFYGAPSSGGTTVPSADAGGILTASHGLGVAPNNYACYLECTATDAGYAVGDRLNADGLLQKGSGGEIRPAVTVGATATQVWAVFIKDGSATRQYVLPNKSTYAEANIVPGNWNVKLYAMP